MSGAVSPQAPLGPLGMVCSAAGHLAVCPCLLAGGAVLPTSISGLLLHACRWQAFQASSRSTVQQALAAILPSMPAEDACQLVAARSFLALF